VQAMRPIGREVGGGIAQRGQSMVSTIAMFLKVISIFVKQQNYHFCSPA